MESKRYAIWGSGEDGRTCYDLLNRMKKEVICFIDSDSSLWETMLFDLPICEPKSIKQFCDEIVLVIGSGAYGNQIRNQIDSITANKNLEIITYEELCNRVIDCLKDELYIPYNINTEYTDADGFVLYDGQIFSEQRYGGITRYFEELISGICRDYAVDLFKGINISESTISRNEQVRVLLDSPPYDSLCENISFRRIMNKIMLKDYQTRGDRYKIYHPTYYEDYDLNCSKKLVVTVYDMVHELFGIDDRVVNKKRNLIEKSDAIIAISDNTKKDLIDIYDVDDDKITVIHLGNSLANVSFFGVCPCDYPYVLYVGNRSGYKNFEVLVKAFSYSLFSNDIRLVCFGGGEFSSNELNMIESLNLKDRVIHMYGDDKVLACLYQHAEMFVYPSKYEGFGLPILEAMHYGTPVITSNVSSMPEVGGNAAVYFDPYSAEELSICIKGLLDNPELRKEYSRRGIERERDFSWKKCVDKTIQLYESL